MPRALHPSAPLKIFELLLVAFVFYHGTWQLQVGLDNAGYVGWIPDGAILITGMVACAWLVWRRRHTERSVLAHVMFVMQLGTFVGDLLKWQAKEEGAAWPVMRCVLGLLFLALIIAEEINHRRAAAKDATRESKHFDMEDDL
ncbi:MAG: hypothetical protein ACO1TE_02920 [Prosthecobacter sp.]